MLRDPSHWDVAEVESLTARLDRRWDFVRFGRAEDELHMLGRFFHCFEQRVERRGREHVDLVNDVDLEVTTHRSVRGVGDQLASFLDLVVRRGVDLDDIGILSREHRVGDVVLVLRIVEFVREDPRHGGLPDPSRSDEEVCVVDTIRIDRGFERLGDRFLSDHSVKGAGAVFTSERGVCHGRSVGASDSEKKPKKRPALVDAQDTNGTGRRLLMAAAVKP